MILRLLVGIAKMLPLSAEAVRRKKKKNKKKNKKTGVFSLNKIKPGMRLNWWPNVGSEPSMISVKMEEVGRNRERI